MSKEEAPQPGTQEVNPDGTPKTDAPPSGGGKRKLIILIIILLILSGIGAYVVLVYVPKNTNIKPLGSGGVDALLAPKDFYVDLDTMSVSLSSATSKQAFLKVTITLQFKNGPDADFAKGKLPVITDTFQTFMRELRVSDLGGSSGVLLLKTELTKRANQVLQPIKVEDILIKEILMG